MDFVAILMTYWPRLLHGALVTLELAFSGALLAAMISPWLALVRANAGHAAQFPLRLYISFARGTPLLAQLFLIYYGAGQFRPLLQEIGLWTFFRDAYNCALLTFVLNSTAYQTEILRGGIMGVAHGEIEAARAIGMGRLTMLRRVIFPHAYRIAWPALGNEVILLIKASALASIVTVFDLLGETGAIFAKTFDFSVYLWAAVLYLVMTAAFAFVWSRIELWLSAHLDTERSLRRRRPQTERASA